MEQNSKRRTNFFYAIGNITKYMDCPMRMVDALAAYGIPARIVVGETLYDTPISSFYSDSYTNHDWVEFYDSASGRWIVCNPAAGIHIPSCWFDLNRTFVANGMKVVRYK